MNEEQSLRAKKLYFRKLKSDIEKNRQIVGFLKFSYWSIVTFVVIFAVTQVSMCLAYVGR